MSPSPAEEQAAVALVDRSFADSMNIIKAIAFSVSFSADFLFTPLILEISDILSNFFSDFIT